MSTTDEEADVFFQRGARTRPGLNGTTAADSSDSSSDIEVVGHSSAAKPTSKRDAKGKQKAVAGAGASSRKRDGHSTAAGSSSTARKTRRTSVRMSSSSSGSSSDEHRAPTSGQGLPFTSTQLVRDGAGLRARAREKGWQGSTPPPRAKRTTQAASRKAAAAADDSESDLSDLGRSRRRVSTSTDQTTVSDRSSSSLTKRKVDASTAATNATTRKRAAAASTSVKVKEPSAPKPRKRRTSRVTTLSPSPEPDLNFDPALQPPPPQSFWGVDASASTSAAAAKKHKHGEATNRLKSLSERAKLLVLPEEDDAMDQDEIDLVDSGSSSAGEPEKYELAAVKAKRQKAEALERLKAKRGRPSDEPVPRNSTPRAEAVGPAPDKGKQRAVAGPATQTCPVCAENIPLADLDRHANDCLDFTGMDDYQPTAAQPRAGPSNAPPGRSAFRPAGAAAAATTSFTASKSTAAQQDNLAAALFPSSPAGQRPAHMATLNARQPPAGGRAAGHDFDDEVVAISPAKKGKGRAVDHRADGYISSNDDLYGTADVAPGVAAQRSFIEIRDDEDDVIIEDGGGSSHRRVAGSSRRSKDGREGPINSEFHAGPPDDGSSPPKGSLYISTMSHAFREGYQRMYARPEPKAKKARTSTGSTSSNGARPYDPDLSDSEARAFDDLAPGPSRRSGGSGRGRGGGGGGKRGGGGRRGSWSWKSRGRGRGAKKS